MPVVEHKPTAPSPVQNNIPKIQSPQALSNVVDTKQQPLSSLIQYVEGALWKINYYSQIIDRDSELRGQDVQQSSIVQQYKKINELEVKVENALSWSQDETTKMITATGSAFINSYLIANVGDMFCADAGDGREGVFQVSTSEKKTFLKDSVYRIEYFLVYFSSEDIDRKADLDKKTLQVYYYSRDFLNNGQNPLIIKDDFYAVQTLQNKQYEIIQNYFAWFFSKEFNTLLIPGQEYRIYDHFVASLMLGITTTTDDPNIRNMRRMNVEDDANLRQPQLFAALLKKDMSLFILGNKEMGLVSTRMFSDDPMMNSVKYVGLHYVVYPTNPAVNADDRFVGSNWQKSLSGLNLERYGSTAPAGDLKSILYADELEYEKKAKRLIKPVSTEGSYVLSTEFYKDEEDQCVLELLVRTYLKSEPVDPKLILQVIKNYTSWGALERFYYLPICLVLIKHSIRYI